MQRSDYDVIIIGAGLSGLTAGINLQLNGRKVLIVEKKEYAGGLCGTIRFNEYEFSKACNDFGQGFKKELERLGVSIQFKSAKSRFIFKHNTIDFPASISLPGKLLPYGMDIIRLIKGFNKYSSLGELLKNEIKSDKFKDNVSMLAYALAIPPDDVRIIDVKDGFSKEFKYGYEKPLIPVGGPRSLIDAMTIRFKSLGGNILFNSTFLTYTAKGSKRNILTDNGNFICDHLISSEPCWNKYPNDSKETLSVSIIHVAVKSKLEFPRGVTTLAYLPENVSEWMTALDLGNLPKEFGFHITKPDLTNYTDHYTLNIYLLSPRGFASTDTYIKEQIETFVFNKANELIPDFKSSILFRKYIAPDDFFEIYGTSSQCFKYVLKDGFKKPPIRDVESDLYKVGNSVYPPGEHAGGAILSALLASEEIMEQS